MPIDITGRASPGWWLNLLAQRANARLLGSGRQVGLNTLWDYYSGDPPPPTSAANAKEAWAAFMRQARTNFAELVVEAVRDRLQVTGIRTGAAADEAGDEAAWRIWQANSLDADQATLFRLALVMRESYVIVGDPSGSDHDEPVITVEDPRQVITAQDPVDKRRVRAGLKQWCDYDEGVERAYLYLPGAVFRAARELPTPQSYYGTAYPISGVRPVATGFYGWEWDGPPQVLPETLAGRVPIVRFVNQPDAYGFGRGEFEGHTDVLDRINTMILQRVVIAVMQAFRQRALRKAADAEPLPRVDPVTGEDIDYDQVFAADPAALWDLPPGIDIWESASADLGPLLQADRSDVLHLAAVTRTPMHYLSPEGANQTAEGASLVREGNISKVTDRQRVFGESVEAMMSLAFLWKGDLERASLVDMETLWQAADQYTLTERMAAAVQAKAAGLPWETILREVLQFTPQQIARADAERASDLLFAPLDTAPAAAPGRGSMPEPMMEPGGRA